MASRSVVRFLGVLALLVPFSSHASEDDFGQFEPWAECPPEQCVTTFHKYDQAETRHAGSQTTVCTCDTPNGRRILEDHLLVYSTVSMEESDVIHQRVKTMVDEQCRLVRRAEVGYTTRGNASSANHIGRVNGRMVRLEKRRMFSIDDPGLMPGFVFYFGCDLKDVELSAGGRFVKKQLDTEHLVEETMVYRVLSAGNEQGVKARLWIEWGERPNVQSAMAVKVGQDDMVLSTLAHSNSGSLWATAQTDEPPKLMDATIPALDVNKRGRVRIQGQMNHPHKAVTARYRLKGIPAYIGRNDLTGPGQRVLAHRRKGEWLVEVKKVRPRSVDAFPMKIGQELGAWTRSTKPVQSHMFRFGQLARKATKDADNAVDAVWALRVLADDWIEDGPPGAVNDTALVTLYKAKGMCLQHTNFFAALARSIGIPVRRVFGLILTRKPNGEMDGGWHAWAEVWVGEWVVVDPIFGDKGGNARQIRFAVMSDDPVPGNQQAWKVALVDISVGIESVAYGD